MPESGGGGQQVSNFNNKALFVVLIGEHDYAKVVLKEMLISRLIAGLLCGRAYA